MATLLELKNLHTYYGQIHALKGIDLTVNEGEIVTLVGANGAGKSTTLRTISGIVRARSGQVLFNGQDVTQMQPHDIARMGIGHVPEGRRIFPQLTVHENLEIGAWNVKSKKDIEERIEHVFQLFPRLKERITQLGGTLSGGEQQMLAIGRALMLRPRLLMLDEPSMGLAPIVVEHVYEKITEIHRLGVAILLIEQNVSLALSCIQRGYVIETGRVVLEGTAEELRGNAAIKEAYLGI